MYAEGSEKKKVLQTETPVLLCKKRKKESGDLFP